MADLWQDINRVLFIQSYCLIKAELGPTVGGGGRRENVSRAGRLGMEEGRGRDLEGRDPQGGRRANLRSSGAAPAPAKTGRTRAQAWKRAKVSQPESE